MCNNQDGELLLSTNSDMFAVGEAEDEANKHSLLRGCSEP